MKVSVKHRPGRASPWCVIFYEDRIPKRKFFRTRDEADRYAGDVRSMVRLGTDLKCVSAALQLIAGTGYDLIEVVRAGLAALNSRNVSGNSTMTTFREAAALMLAKAQKRGLAKITLDGYKAHIGIHTKVFGDRIARFISEEEVEAYLNRILSRWSKGQQCAEATKQTYLRTIKMVLRTAGVEKPLPNIIVRLPKEDPKFFSVEQVRAMFTAARRDERGLLALAIFAGLRPWRLPDLPPECVCVSERKIHIPRSVAKNRSAFDLYTGTSNGHQTWPGLPPVLWLWLEKYPFVPKLWHHIQSHLARAIGFAWVHDGCRHTAATYYNALHGLAATSELLTHFSRTIVTKHYVGYATREQALQFYAITPDSIPEPAEPSWKRLKIQISSAELTALLRIKPLSRIAVEIGCSDALLIKHCRKNGIPTLKRGGWTARTFQEIYGKKSAPDNGVVESLRPPENQKPPSDSNDCEEGHDGQLPGG